MRMSMLPRILLPILAAAMMTVPAIAAEATPDALVDALNTIFGKHKGLRASHAKGFCVKGSFSPAAEASALSKAPQFAKEVPIIGRFSMGGGNPKISDKAKTTRGLAVRFDLGSGNASDLVMITAPIFFARTPEQMLGFLEARFSGADGKPDPAKVKAFGEANPETGKQAAFVNARPSPASYATTNYWGVHAFTLKNAQDAAVNVRLKAIPAAGEVGLSDDDAKAKPDDFLEDELKERLGTGPVAFNLVAIIGQQGDSLSDPTEEWPEASRKTLGLGAISISELEPNATCDAITFDPTNLPAGIEGPENDPIFAMRSPAYAVSLTRRMD